MVAERETRDILHKKCPCRKQEIDNLLAVMGECEDCCYKSVFVYGNTACGKTHVMRNIVTLMKLPHSFINCIEYFTVRHMYQEILKEVGYESVLCTTTADFIRLLKQSEYFQSNKETFYIVFDKADRLRKLDENLLSSFLRMAELTKLNICIVFITDIIFEKFMTTTGMHEPIKIHFQDYVKSELECLMCLNVPDGYTREFYKRYCDTILNTFHMVTRDLTELKHLAAINFSKYCEPIVSGEMEQNNVVGLFNNIRPHLRKALQTVYLREVSSRQWEIAQEEKSSAEKKRSQVELPYYSKYLLLAAYFASYNPATTDRRFFAKKCTGKMSNRMKRSTKTTKNTEKKFLGPKAFPFDRLMAIFYSIVEVGASSSANILTQLSTLVTLNLLTKVSADDQIDSPKYKCIVPLEFAVEIGKQVEMDVYQCLYDYL